MQGRVRVVGIDTPLDARDQIRLSVTVEITWPGVRAVVRDADRLTEAAHGFRFGEDRIGLAADVAQQVDAAAVLRSMVRARHAIDQIL